MSMTPEERGMLERIDERTALMLERFDTLEERHHSLEKRVWWSSGAAAVIGAFAVKLGIPWPTV